MFISTAPGLVQFQAVEGNGFFAEHVFARCQRRQQITDMRIMGRRNIDDIDVGIRKDILWLVVDLGDAVFFSKRQGLFMGPVADTVQIPAQGLHSLGQFITDDAAAQSRPTICWHNDSPFYDNRRLTSLTQSAASLE